MEFVTENIPNFIDIALSVVGAFAVVATMTANESDNAVANFLLKLVNFLGANFGRAANAEDDPEAGRSIRRG